MSTNASRRNFLRTAPLAAAFAISLDDPLSAEVEMAAAPVAYQLFPAAALQEDKAALLAKPGNNNLVDAKTLPFAIVMTVEERKAAKEFEWHEGRDHIVQILDGTTTYEIGGMPQGPHSPKPGEWLAPASAGSETIILKKGDMLVIPRRTPHKRTTEASVTFILISPSGMVMA